jgi:acyl-[acyl carrier protein]--UDP-N-acetylglucosamine O-acyltransferase
MIRNAARIVLGKGNYIEEGVRICKGVIIGDHNKIYRGTTIYPNTVIGSNNVILNNNVLGETPVHSAGDYSKKTHNGLRIGDNNVFHVNNIVFSGAVGTTTIMDNNKVLAEAHIGHDTVIHNNVTLYPRVITGGHSVLQDYASVGMNSVLQQRATLGAFAMIGMGSAVSHSVFPFFIHYKNEYVRLNRHRIPDEMDIERYEPLLRQLVSDIQGGAVPSAALLYSYAFPQSIHVVLEQFIDSVVNAKV